jgi:hypothetical protein
MSAHPQRPGLTMSRLKRLLLRLRGPLLPIEGFDRTGAGADLAVCGACGSRVVNPVDWHEHDESSIARLDRERMQREAEVFIAALGDDLIGPADFSSDLPRD